MEAPALFADTLTLVGLADAARTFRLVRQDGTGTERVDVAGTAAAPIKMAIKHQVQGNGPAATDRHLVQISRSKQNSTTGRTVVSTVNLTISVPRDDTITSANVHADLITLLRFIAGEDFGVVADYGSETFDSLILGES